jgi:Ca2+-binding RTX toxin-like protein
LVLKESVIAGIILVVSLSVVGSLPLVRSVEGIKGINNNKIDNNIVSIHTVNTAAADSLFKLPLPFDIHTALKQVYGIAVADDAGGNNIHTGDRLTGHSSSKPTGHSSSKLAGNNPTPTTASAMRNWCINNTPQGGTPHITRQGNTITGTDCDDIIRGSNRDSNIIFTLAGNDIAYGGKNNDIIYAGSGDNKLYGGYGDDILVTSSGNSLADGGPGDDVLLGASGNDLLVGGDGNDKLFAGPGNTIMDGGPGVDHFDCGPPTTSVGPKAVVLDYNPSQGDTIVGNCKIVNTVRN